jgi:hypothetical protein
MYVGAFESTKADADWKARNPWSGVTSNVVRCDAIQGDMMPWPNLMVFQAGARLGQSLIGGGIARIIQPRLGTLVAVDCISSHLLSKRIETPFACLCSTRM